jgi:ankyrin repeat protein
LHNAVLANHPDAAKPSITAGVPFNDLDKFGYTPLLHASAVEFRGQHVNLLLHAMHAMNGAGEEKANVIFFSGEAVPGVVQGFRRR